MASFARRMGVGSKAPKLSRRDLLRLSAAGVMGASYSGWLESLAAAGAKDPQRRGSCILLWMNGGPSQIDTFDPKPGHPNGGIFKPIDTSAPGIQVCEHLPELAKQMHHLALIRSMTTQEGDHSRGTFHMRTGYLPQGPLQYPTLGSLISKELGSEKTELPNFVSIAPYRTFSPAAYGPGFLGSRYAPLIVGETATPNPGQANNNDNDEYDFSVEDLKAADGIDEPKLAERLGLLRTVQRRFIERRPGAAAVSHQVAYRRAIRLMHSEAARAFEIEEETDAVRDAYGRTPFGQGCLLARRLVEQGVPFIEVSLSGVDGGAALGWDTHADNFDSVRDLCGVLDPAWATLIKELQDRGLLETTQIVWMGEFGRTPKINENGGRDHYPQAWSTVLAGGGIKGGQVVGKTSADGMTVEERPVKTPDFLGTVCKGLGIDPTNQNLSNVGRPVRLVDPEAKPIEEILA